MSGRCLTNAPQRRLVLALALLLPGLQPRDACARQDAGAAPPRSAEGPTLCGQTVSPPASLPPDGSGPVIYLLSVCFEAQGNVSLVGVDTYLHYIQMRPSRPSQAAWVPFDDDAVAVMRADFRRLWATSFLDDLKIEATDYVFANGVVGKLVTYHLEERPRARVISYEGSKSIDSAAIEKALLEKGLELRVDTFLDQSTLARVTSTIRDLLEAKGHLGAEVAHVMTPIAGSAKAVNVVFTIADGPRVSLRDVEFLGNTAFDDDTLARALKANRPRTLISLFSDRGHYQPTSLEEDATLIEGFYRDRGFIEARVGQPELRTLEDSPDGATRWAQLRFPVNEGRRFRVGTVTFEGHTLVDASALQAILGLESGDWYSEDRIRVGLNKARELYGAVGHMEFTGYPDLTPRPDEPEGPAIVDVVIRMAEGPRYTVNRLTFTGNTTTRDSVVRREMRLLEGGVFNTEALKMSVQRLNQLGYFKPLEGNETDVTVEKAANVPDAVDVTLKLQEQNRNSVQFGGGVSQYDGLFANVSYTTTNFLGRGESVTVLAQKGNRSSTYQFGLTEPFLFDRPLSGGVDVYSRKVDFLTGIDEVGYSEVRSGANVTAGYRLFNFGRAFLGYGYEVVQTSVSDDIGDLLGVNAGAGVPLFTSGLDTGRNTESRLSPSLVYDTVDNPLLPRRGRRLVMSLPVAGGWLGGTVQYLRPEAEVVQYLPVARRMALGARVKAGLLHPYGRTSGLPYYLRYYLGGEYEVRGYDIRTVGPTDAQNRALGGNKFLLVNVEYYFDLFGPVRALLFHDAGQAFAEADAIDIRQLRSSSGVELRFLMPVLNVPFRLIHAWNIYRDAFQPARTFRFAIGTTF